MKAHRWPQHSLRTAEPWSSICWVAFGRFHLPEARRGALRMNLATRGSRRGRRTEIGAAILFILGKRRDQKYSAQLRKTLHEINTPHKPK
jgi:hypothetical protein